jgi:hypothetical protein
MEQMEQSLAEVQDFHVASLGTRCQVNERTPSVLSDGGSADRKINEIHIMARQLLL